jgi:hypothetical protein
LLLRKDWHFDRIRAVMLQAAAKTALERSPARAIARSGAEVVRRMASRKPREASMTNKTKSKRKSATRSGSVRAAKQQKSSKKSTSAGSPSGAITKARAGTKKARILAMLRDRTGTTIAAITAATGWQPQSVRGFFAGVVRKKLDLNLVSEAGNNGRVYRIIDAPAGRIKQAV